MKKGMLVNVFRCELTKNCTEGITSKNEKLILIQDDSNSLSPDVPQIFEEEFQKTLILKAKKIGNNIYLYAVPKDITTEESFMNGPMFGGNFVYTSDSRFPNQYPIPVHDRFEH